MLKKILKAALVVGSVAVLGGCYTMGAGKDYPEQGQLWRGDITRQYNSTSLAKIAREDGSGIPGYVKSRDSVRRFTQIRTFGHGTFKDLLIGSALVPDNIEFSDLEKGAIVDFVIQKGTDMDISKNKITRIIHLVCKGSDTACISNEKKSNRLFTVIESNVPNDYMGGNTYNRQVSPEDRKLYE